jgi:hypothetical protein
MIRPVIVSVAVMIRSVVADAMAVPVKAVMLETDVTNRVIAAVASLRGCRYGDGSHSGER